MASQEIFVGSIDQGTTSTRFLIFNREGEPIASHQIEFKQIYPQPGYVWKSHIFATVLTIAQMART
jgi:glycerol kinase